jgi:hypothetical protein
VGEALAGSPRSVIVDASALEFVDSTGLMAVVRACDVASGPPEFPCEQIVTGAAAHRRACRLDDPAGSTTVSGLRHQIATRPLGEPGALVLGSECGFSPQLATKRG